jgi:hypothetical protein
MVLDIGKARLEPSVDDVGVGDARALHPAFTPLLWPTATAVELLLVSLLVLPTATAVELLLVSLLLWPTSTAVELLLVSLLVLLLRLQQGPADHIIAYSVISISNNIKFSQTAAVSHIFGFQSREQHLPTAPFS